MKLSKITLILAALFLSLFLSACSGSRFAATSWPGLTVAGDTIYVASGSHVYSVKVGSSTETWKFPQETNRAVSFFAAPAIGNDGQLVFGGYDNILYSISAENGVENWRFEDSSTRFIASPEVDEEYVYAANAGGEVFALAVDGNPRWSEPFKTNQAIWGSPVTDSEVMFTGSLDHFIYAINQENGTKVWEKDLGASVVGTPTYLDGILYVGTFGSEFFTLDDQNGAEIWKFKTADWVWSGATIHDGVIYFGDMGGNLYAVDLASGEKIWDRATDGAIFGAPLIFEETIYVGTESGSIYTFELNGDAGWNKTFDGKIYGSPVVVEDKIVFATLESDNLLTAIDASGNAQWNYTPEE